MSFVPKSLLLTALILLFGSVLPQASHAAPPEVAAVPAVAPTQEPIDINTATVKELMKLPHVGAVTARRIVDYRKAIGPFKKLEELLNVKGIGERTFARIRSLVTLGETVSMASTARTGGQ